LQLLAQLAEFGNTGFLYFKLAWGVARLLPIIHSQTIEDCAPAALSRHILILYQAPLQGTPVDKALGSPLVAG
jgi:hypothetical protein